MMDSLDQSDLNQWLEHPITVLFHKRMLSLNEELKDDLLNASMVLSAQGQIHYAFAAAKRELIEEIIHLRIDDLLSKEEETEKDDQ
jgi:hypothetical protein